ncbi:MAG: hypothetical protein K2F57_07155 [Candidatus Gastranaerophilales bacterium]|nr:hypothetical protein [Candidatus Gastranaerophilales bacterium]
MDNINTNVNFTARMNINKVTINKARWAKIAEVFEQKTAKYPNDTFYMEDITTGISAYNINSKTGNEICANIFGIEFDKLMNMSDSKIASKFKKILDITAHKQRIYDATTEYTKKIFKLTKEPANDSIIWDEAVKIATNEAKSMLNKDSFLKDVDILF